MVTSFTRDGDTGSRVLHAIIGVVSVIVGWALLRTPFQSVEVFIFVIGIFFLVQGVMTFIARVLGKQGRNWRIAWACSGSSPGIIVLTYPISSAVTLAFIAGIWLVILGSCRSSWASSSAGRRPQRKRVAPSPRDGVSDRPTRRPVARASVLSCRAAPTRRPRRLRSRPRPGLGVLAPA